jgi:hypothetical protein
MKLAGQMRSLVDGGSEFLSIHFQVNLAADEPFRQSDRCTEKQGRGRRYGLK